MSTGSLTCVGIGITLGSHITAIAKEHITSSDICFVAVSDALVELWVCEMHQDVRSLQIYYGSGKSRKKTYAEMVDAVLNEVKAGKKVCGVFYGHPGVFAYVPHQMIKKAREFGCIAIMEPGISAEDCLIADLGIDPGKYGCQQYEASQFLMYKRVIDSSAYLILWQIGVVGDLSFGIEVTSAEHRRLLLKLLYNYYPQDHQVILYEARTLPFNSMRADYITLKSLENVVLHDYTTLIIPPATPMKKNHELIRELQQIKHN